MSFLKKRFEALTKNPLFHGMEFSDDPKKLKDWIPLIMHGRTTNEPIAATKIGSGTDINFGALTRMLFKHLESKNVEVNYNYHVENMNRTRNKMWELKIRNLQTGSVESHTATFVFVGGGGGSLHSKLCP